MLSVKVEQLASDPNAGLSLRLVAGRAGLSRRVTVPRIQKPGLALTGYTEQVHRERVQVLGATEMGYLEHLSPSARTAGIANLIALEPACVCIMRGLPAFQEMLQLADDRGVALMVSPLMSSVFI